MPKVKFSIAHNDDEMLALVQDTDQKTWLSGLLTALSASYPTLSSSFQQTSARDRRSKRSRPG